MRLAKAWVVVMALTMLPACMRAATTQGGANEAAGTIEAVTVYRGQALVTRLIEVDAPAGGTEVVVVNLPTQILPESIFATAEGGAQIRAVRYRARAVQEEPREEVRKLDQAIDDTQKALRKNRNAQALIQQKEMYLSNLERFTAEQAKQDIAKGTLNPEAVKTVTDYIFQNRTTLSEGSLTLAEEMQATTEKLSLLQRQREEIAQRFSRTAREAVLFVDKPAAGKATLHLNYLVQGAGWSPVYNIRSAGAGKELTLEYNALVQQMSGEDWVGVKIALSTASPNMLADPPVLTPLWVTLGRGVPQGNEDAQSLHRSKQMVLDNLARALDERRHATSQPAAQMDYDYRANEWANRLQIVDLTAGKEALLVGRGGASEDGALSVNYALPGSLSIPSRSDQQMVQIASLKLEAGFYYQAAPVLTPYVYQLADVTNTSEIALLSGSISAYMDGQFMGTGHIPMVAKGQHFTVGFGVDSQLRVMRELADKTDKTQGGNRELTFKYRLLVDNYKDKPVKVRVLDRLPDPKSVDIRVALGESNEKVNEDPVYQRTLRKDGILRWDIDVPAHSSGAAAKSLEYDYKVEFDKNMALAEPTPAEVEKDKIDFEDKLMRMERGR